MAKSLIPGRSVINLTTKDAVIKIAIMNNSVGADIKTQKENAEILIDKLSQI